MIGTRWSSNLHPIHTGNLGNLASVLLHAFRACGAVVEFKSCHPRNPRPSAAFAMLISSTKSSACSEDLRWRMVWQREALGLNLKTVASNLGVDPSTVSRVVRLFRDTGSVEKRPYPKNSRPNKKLSMPVQLTILHTVLQYPGIYLREIQVEVYVLTGVEVSVSSLCVILHSSNFTRQKMQMVAKQYDRAS